MTKIVEANAAWSLALSRLREPSEDAKAHGVDHLSITPGGASRACAAAVLVAMINAKARELGIGEGG